MDIVARCGRLRGPWPAGVAIAVTMAAILPARTAEAAAYQISAPLIRQQHSLDCEATALQIALAARRITVSQDWVLAQIGADTRRPVLAGGSVLQWGDPYQTFVGDVDGSEPGLTGYGVYAPPVAAAADAAGARAVARSGWDPATLYAHVQHGDPVIAWVVNGMTAPPTRWWTAWDGRAVPWSIGEHAEVMVGVDTGAAAVTLDNPETGSLQTVSMRSFEASFGVFGNMAVALLGGTAAMLPSAGGHGYALVGTDGSVQTFGDAMSYGSMSGAPLQDPVVGAAPTPSGHGYWMVASDGGIFAFGDARYLGSTGADHLNRPVVGMAVTPSGNGYWLAASDGGVFSFGDAAFLGSTGNLRLNSPVVGIAPTPSGRGYWLVAADGGVFSFGDAPFHGSMGGQPLTLPVVGMSSGAGGPGYRLVAADGGVFSFGPRFYGSTGAMRLNESVIAMLDTADGGGYWFVAIDGGVFSFGDAPFYGSGAAG